MNPLSPTWSQRLRAARLNLGDDQEEMGKRLGVSREWISKIENGREEMGELIQIKLARIEQDIQNAPDASAV